MVVYGTSVGAIVRQPRPQATGTSGAICCPRTISGRAYSGTAGVIRYPSVVIARL
jgi:hypothetical protein